MVGGAAVTLLCTGADAGGLGVTKGAGVIVGEVAGDDAGTPVDILRGAGVTVEVAVERGGDTVAVAEAAGVTGGEIGGELGAAAGLGIVIGGDIGGGVAGVVAGLVATGATIGTEVLGG